LFTSDTEMLDFLSGPGHDEPATRLFGENPATFPTVRGQLVLAGEPDPSVDLVIINGGANDTEFEEVLDPTGPTPSAITRTITEVCGRMLRDLLTETRRQFPSAVIIVPGYFSALSVNSDRGDLKELFEYLSEKPEWQLAVNGVVQTLPAINTCSRRSG
jgi:lysophospholipase L1-like esterase